MKTQFLSDGNGKHSAIVIPIKDWEIITLKYPFLKNFNTESEQKNRKQKLSGKYKGIISKVEGEQLNKHIKKMRNEWNTI